MPPQRAPEDEQGARGVEGKARGQILGRRPTQAVCRVVVVHGTPQGDERLGAQRARTPPGVSLPLGELAEPSGDLERLVALPELDERLDQVGCDGKHPWLVDALGLGVLPDLAKRSGSRRGVVREKRGEAECSSCLEQIPAHTLRFGRLECLTCPGAGRGHVTATGGEQAAAALVHGPHEPVVRLAPVVEQRLRVVPAAGPELQLAYVQAEQEERRVAPLVRALEERREKPPALVELPAPDEALAGDALRVDRSLPVRNCTEPLEDVADREPPERPRPRKPLERRLGGGGLAAHLERLERPALDLRDSLDAERRSGLGNVPEHRRPEHGIVVARREGLVENALNVGSARDAAPVPEEKVGTNPLRPGQPLERRAEEVGDRVPLADRDEELCKGEDALRASTIRIRREPERMLSELDRVVQRAAQRRFCGSGCNLRGERRVRALRCERQMPRSELRLRDDARERAMEGAPLRRTRSTCRRGGEQGVKRPHAAVAGNEQPRRERLVDRRGAHDLGQLLVLELTAQREGEEERSRGRRQTLDAQAEELLDALRHRDLPSGVELTLFAQQSAELEREKRIPQRDRVHATQQMPGQGQIEPFGEEPAKGGEAQRLDREPREADALECPFESSRWTGSPRQEEADVGIREPTCGERERGGALRVEPLEIVDGDDDRPAARELSQHAENPEGGRALGGRLGRRRAEKRRVECLSLRVGKLGERFVGHFGEQVAEPGKCKPGLDVGGACDENTTTARACSPNAGFPQRRLSDSRLARQQEAPCGRDTRNGGRDRGERSFSAEDRSLDSLRSLHAGHSPDAVDASRRCESYRSARI